MPKPLAVYRAKRDFSKTAEPSGALKVAPSKRLRFIVQKHAARQLHYDLRLELGGVFKSWAVARGPSLDPADKRLAVEVEDHPLDYGDFEGTIPKGEYGGGTVQLWDRGFWTPEGAKTPQEALASGDLKFTLDGERLHGSWVLVRMRGDRYGGKRTNWLLIKHRDEAADPGNAQGLLDVDRSVASGRTLEEIAAGVGNGPKPFMLASSKAARADAQWRGKSAEDASAGARDVAGAGAGAGAGTRARAGAGALPGAGAGAGAVEGAASVQAKRATDRRAPVRRVMVKHMPDFVEPQLCKLVERPPGEPGWAHEVKLDGYRAQLRVQKHRAVIRTRTGLDWTDRFAAIAADARVLPDCLMDGEVIALDETGMPSFAALQAALSNENSKDLSFFAFDLLFAAREDLRALPLQDRKARLQALLSGPRISDRLHYVAHLTSDAHAIYASACKMNLEGIVSKKLDAPYRSGRSGDWAKAKCRAGQEIVIGGWTSESGAVRSLLAGVYRDGKLNYVGRVGTGYSQRVAKALSPRLEALTRASSPFSGDNAPTAAPKVRWLAPKLVAEIEFAGWTASGMIRQAAFKGLREDKPANEVVAELPVQSVKDLKDVKAGKTGKIGKAEGAAEAGGAGGAGGAATISVTTKRRKASAARQPPPAASSTRNAAPAVVMGVSISKPQKALWPGAGDSIQVTKLDLANYYEAVGDWMLPHLAGRPCSIVRVPDGFGGEQFFQRHAMAGQSPLVSSVTVKGDKAPYLQIDRVEALAWVAQVGGLELHPWNCVPGNPEVAGRLVFDLDPAPDVKFNAVIAGALEIRERLEALGLQSFCKTTGGKGLHVVTPLTGDKNAVAWPVAKNFAHIICAQMVQDSPAKYLDNMAKKQRVGKIFLDYLRNDRTATAVAVLSPRAREGAPVSMPIHWQDVRAGLDPKAFTVRTAPKLLRQEKPWQGYAKAARSLSDAIRSVTGAAKARNVSPRTG